LQTQIQNSNAKILTDPTITIQEGQTAQVNLTQEVFGGTETVFITPNAGGNAIPSFRPIIKEAGLTVLVQIARIDDNGFVSLSVAPTVSAISGDVTTQDFGTITLLSERSLTSGQIRLRDGQTLILSGIIQDSDRATVSKVPILGDIPILGALFRSTSKSNQRQEVIVLLTPQILNDAANTSVGSNYTPGAEARQMLERRNFQAPATSR
jgi:type IV pilus assembly protein PilQ